MELGEKLRQARLEAGLSQRQLCGNAITRNMLSQIENGTARPSMDTLRYLAARLGKSLGYFLDDEAPLSPAQAAVEKARASYDAGDMSGVLAALSDIPEPDGAFARERELLEALAYLGLAEEAIGQKRPLYAQELLEKAKKTTPCYLAEELERKRLLLLGLSRDQGLAELCQQLPCLDRELLLRAAAALEGGDPHRCGALLEAAEDRTGSEWNLLRGRAWLAQGAYAQAAACLHRAEDTHPATAALLEHCYRELEDYKQAYYYACKQKA